MVKIARYDGAPLSSRGGEDEQIMPIDDVPQATRLGFDP